ncbi:MAG: FIST C-terminal domain-containing protein [Candidatus Dormibacteraeota bacterium]|uniref:FIST C-terminal domain-containing protein n=1 Tax=Candidatus Amunia macphersoniae TaxID=3127014 RepID=A0A934KE11_9BACT|nr:FIST C-terminal domain-containing protein [Candidatus Dormibacteraeota bacterium]
MATRAAPSDPRHAVAATTTRWFGVGRSAETDSARAGKQAASGALRGEDPRLVMVFASATHDLGALLSSIREQTGDTPLVGCSTAGEIASDGPGDSGVVVIALGGPGFVVRTAVARGVSARLRDAGAEVAACAGTAPEHAHQALLLFSDGLSGDQTEIVRGAYAVVGAATPLVGGCAGDDLQMQRTRQLYGGEVLDDAVVGAWLASDSPLGIGVQHGWSRVGEPMLVTGSEGSKVLTLDDQPALDVYLERLSPPAEAHRSAQDFTQFALTHPLGLSRRSGEEVRFIAGADLADRSLNCIASVPQGALVWMMEGDSASVLAATDAACEEAIAALGGGTPIGMLAFDCIARRGVLGDGGIKREVDRIAAHADGSPVAGFYTYGEIARTRGVNGFHNQTLVVLALA